MGERRRASAKAGGGIVQRNGSKRAPLEKEHVAEFGVTDPCRVLQHGLKHRRQVARRARNDLQDVRRRSLLLQRLGQLARALLFGINKPHVLDRDHRLVGKGLQKFFLDL